MRQKKVSIIKKIFLSIVSGVMIFNFPLYTTVVVAEQDLPIEEAENSLISDTPSEDSVSDEVDNSQRDSNDEFADENFVNNEENLVNEDSESWDDQSVNEEFSTVDSQQDTPTMQDSIENSTEDPIDTDRQPQEEWTFWDTHEEGSNDVSSWIQETSFVSTSEPIVKKSLKKTLSTPLMTSSPENNCENAVANIGETCYSTLEAAISASSEWDTITMNKDYTVTNNKRIYINTWITLDLNGYTISKNVENTEYVFQVNAWKSLTIEDTRWNGKISRERGLTAIMVLGTLTVNWWTIESLNGKQWYTISIKCDEDLANNISWHVIVEHGTIIWDQAIQNRWNVTINGGSFSGDINSWSYQWCFPWDTTINGGDIKGNVQSIQRWNVSTPAVTTINGWTIDGMVSVSYKDIDANEGKNSPQMRSSTNQLNSPEWYTRKQNGEYYQLYQVYPISYTGLDTATNHSENITWYTQADTFTFFPATKDGMGFEWWYVWTQKITEISKWTTGAMVLEAHWWEIVATIWDTNYSSLASAFESAQNGDEVILQKDITINENATIEINKNLTLNLNQKTITYHSNANNKNSYKPLFDVVSNGTLTLNGNGKIEGPTSGNIYDGKVLISVSGKLNYQNGTMKAYGNWSDWMYGVYVLDNGTAIFGTEDGTGPTITSHFAAIGTNNTTASANITIYGGTYKAEANPNNTSTWWHYFCAPLYAASAGNYDIQWGTFQGFYGISTRYAQANQTITVGNATFETKEKDLFVDYKNGTTNGNNREIISTTNTHTLPEGYEWVKEGNVYKVWHTVTFDSDWWTTITEQHLIEGKTIVRPEDPIKEWSWFGWWFIDEREWNFDNDVVTWDLTLKAKWGDPLMVTFKSEGSEDIQKTVAENSKVTAPTVVRTGYTLSWWKIDEDSDFFDFSTIITWSITLTATWRINQYTLTFDTDEWTSIDPITADYNTPLSMTTKPTKTWYNFSWWEPTIPTVMPAKDLTIKAKWTKKSTGWGGWWWGWSSYNSNTHINTWDVNNWSHTNEKTISPKKISFSIEDEMKKLNCTDLQQLMEDGLTCEMHIAYKFAFQYGITTKPTIQEAEMLHPLTRITMAKMLSYYAINILWVEPDTTKEIHFSDVTDEMEEDYDHAITLAYQLWIMGINTSTFNSLHTVLRADLATVMSRTLYHTPDGISRYYEPHIQRLHEEKIIKDLNPWLIELKGFAMIMLMRDALGR